MKPEHMSTLPTPGEIEASRGEAPQGQRPPAASARSEGPDGPEHQEKDDTAELIDRILAGPGEFVIWRRTDALLVTVQFTRHQAADVGLPLYMQAHDSGLYAASDNPPVVKAQGDPRGEAPQGQPPAGPDGPRDGADAPEHQEKGGA